MSSTVTDNPQRSRFELDVDGQIVFASYRRDGDKVYIHHVEAPPPLRGTGAASRLMEGIMDRLRAAQQKVVPYCSYASWWMRQHGEHQDLLG